MDRLSIGRALFISISVVFARLDYFNCRHDGKKSIGLDSCLENAEAKVTRKEYKICEGNL